MILNASYSMRAGRTGSGRFSSSTFASVLIQKPFPHFVPSGHDSRPTPHARARPPYNTGIWNPSNEGRLYFKAGSIRK